MGYRAFCERDWALVVSCLRDLPGIFLRLSAEIGQPAVTGTRAHVPFGPSVALRLDVDEAMRLTATRLAVWEARVRAVCPGMTPRDPSVPVLSPEGVRDAARTLTRNDSVLLALADDWMTQNVALPVGRRRGGTRGAEGICRKCGRLISYSTASKRWWAADGETGFVTECEHAPRPGAAMAPAGPIPAELTDEYGDAEIVRMGVDFMGLWVRRGAAAAGLEILHLHYWDRAVLAETPARPEELLGVECRACSLLALRRAEPAWFSGDPDYYSECADCGDLMTEDDYRLWVGQLAAYHRARLAAAPVLGELPAR